MNTRLYVAGPMTGLPGFNYPSFRAATLQLLLRGYEVEDPSTNADQGSDYAAYIRLGLLQMLRCDGIALLPHWGASRGVLLELTVAQAIGIPVKTVEEWLHERDLTTTGGAQDLGGRPLGHRPGRSGGERLRGAGVGPEDGGRGRRAP